MSYLWIGVWNEVPRRVDKNWCEVCRSFPGIMFLALPGSVTELPGNILILRREAPIELCNILNCMLYI